MSSVLISCFDESERRLCSIVVEVIPRIGETVSLIPNFPESVDVYSYRVVNVVHGFHYEQTHNQKLRDCKLPTSIDCRVRVSLILARIE